MSKPQEESGYRGIALKALLEAGVSVGDVIRVQKDGTAYEGILIPRSELGDDKHLVIKLKNGYNIGIEVTDETIVERIRKGVKPSFLQPELPSQREGLPRVAIISTGGTIASRVDYRTGGVRPALSASDLYSVVPELSEIALIDTEILFSLLSENITAQHWREMAKTVSRKIAEGAEGVVIAHGTDTMGYTSAALSFALENLPVPVILVGSQRSADRPSSDAASNLIGGVKAASSAPFAEVTVGMHETSSDTSITFHRGTKVRKCHTSGRFAFKSVNTDPIARFKDGEIVMLTDDYVKREPGRELCVKSEFEEKVALLKFHPNMNPEIIDSLTETGYRGIVLEGTGLGHVSSYCFDSIKRAVENEVLVVMTSQCIWGRVNMNVYDTGRDLQALGVLPMGDMLPETTLVKMMWVLGQTSDAEEAKRLMRTNLAHEFSPRTIQ